MDDPKDSARTHADAERTAALGAWSRGELQVGDDAVPSAGELRRMLRDEPRSDTDDYAPPPRRAVFPPSFLAVIALCLAAVALEPTAALSWHLFGPADTIDLGEPAHYRLDALADGQRVRIEGIASPRRGQYTRWGETWEVFALIGTPILVRAQPGEPRPDPEAAELVTAEGRLVKLDRAPSSFFERLVRPTSRYTSMKLTFEALGELPPGRPVFLVLDGDLPRSSFFALVAPLVLWGLCLLVAVSAVRATLRRRAAGSRAPRSS